ncbi:MAG: hypothetical protein RLZZ338_4580 [Cyanobacteriota bacterium]|jgi:uncharacterized protein with ParB-like and HNH nuclease domain
MVNLFTNNNDEWDEEIEFDDAGVNQPFDPTQIRVDTRQLTIDLVLKRIKYNELELSPDFQRKSVWNDEAKSRLIESILIRIPLPAFYLDATEDDKWVIIDGLQRLTALKEFILEKNTEQQLRLNGLNYLRDIEGKSYQELPRNYQRRIEETQLTIYLIEKGTPTNVKYEIFRRINTGGMPLSPQEIRNALNQGEATKFIAELADMEEFKKVTKLDQSKRKLRATDQEFVLGFLAYTLNDYHDFEKAESRDMFFHSVMKKLNEELSPQQINELKRRFKRSMKATYDIFGDRAFRKPSTESSPNSTRLNPINQALFEVWSVSLSNLSDAELTKLQNKRDELTEKFTALVTRDKEFLKSISESRQKVTLRFSRIEKLIKDVLT